MTTYNTGNPIGSSDPRDLYDNAENLDEAANSSADTYQDRLGKSRLTWSGIVKAGTGDAGVIVPIVQQAVQDVVAGVDGQVAVAESAADRAEAAKDAAFVNADVYPNVAAGLAAVADGEQFQVLSEDALEYIRYLKDAGVATELPGRKPSTKMVNDAVTKINQKIRTDPSDNDLYWAVDLNGEIFHRFDENGEQYIAGLDGKSVQGVLSGTSTSRGTSGIDDRDLLIVKDADDMVVVRLDGDGGLHLPGITGSIQGAILRQGAQAAGPKRHPRDFFSDDVNKYVMALTASGMGMAPIPLTLQPTSYTVPDSMVDDLKLTPPEDRLYIDTPYNVDDRVVHPYVIECYGTFRGYRYIMSINPYTAESHENPVIYGSNDLAHFEMLTGFPQPLDTPDDGGFLSDTGFTYDPCHGELICFWRRTRRPEGGAVLTEYACSKTKDGINWTPREIFFPEVDNAVDGLTSPAFLYDPQTSTWHMWNVPAKGKLSHRTAPTLYGPWTDRADFPVGGTTPWHIEVKWVGDKMVMLINRSGGTSNYFLAISSDRGDTWRFGSSPMFDVQMDAIYKATFLPAFTPDGDMYLDVIYTTNHTTEPDDRRRLYHVQSNAIEI